MKTARLLRMMIKSATLLLLTVLLRPNRSIVSAEICLDHPRFAPVCGQLANLEFWCQDSQAKGFKNNIASVCRATCGLCQDSTATEVVAPTEEKSVHGTEEVQEEQEEQEEQQVQEATKPTTFRPDPDLSELDQLFQYCCSDHDLPMGCIEICRYDVSKTEMQNAVNSGDCPIEEMWAYFYCASRTRDNRKCCRDKNVYSRKQPLCQGLCDPTGNTTKYTQEQTACLSKTEQIMDCHWSGVKELTPKR